MDFNYYSPPQSDLSAPARRASIVLWVVGALFLTCGLCAGLVLVVPTDQLMAQMGNNAPPGMAPDQIVHQALLAAVILGVVALFLITLGFFVRRGGQGSLIVGVVVCGIIIALMTLDLLSSIVMAGRNPMVILGGCILAIPMGLLILTMVWLVQALSCRAADSRATTADAGADVAISAAGRLRLWTAAGGAASRIWICSTAGGRRCVRPVGKSSSAAITCRASPAATRHSL